MPCIVTVALRPSSFWRDSTSQHLQAVAQEGTDCVSASLEEAYVFVMTVSDSVL